MPNGSSCKFLKFDVERDVFFPRRMGTLVMWMREKSGEKNLPV